MCVFTRPWGDSHTGSIRKTPWFSKTVWNSPPLSPHPNPSSLAGLPQAPPQLALRPTTTLPAPLLLLPRVKFISCKALWTQDPFLCTVISIPPCLARAGSKPRLA